MARIAVSGSSGFVGKALLPRLAAAGHEVVALVRPGRRSGTGSGGDPGGGAGGAANGVATASWDPATGAIDRDRLDGIDALVHLAGEPIAAGRWTAARRRRIHESRGPATERLCRSLAGLARPPRIVLSASGVNVYGDRGDEVLDGDSAPGSGFLADVARHWEAATAPLGATGARVVHLRLAMVLGNGGGALPRLLLPFRLGLGGPLGNGRQWTSWIALPDLLGIVEFALADDAVRGAVECAAPEPVQNRDFARALGKALHRPAVLPAPAFALRLLLGRTMADELLLSSIRVVPNRLRTFGYRFLLPGIDAAFAAILAK